MVVNPVELVYLVIYTEYLYVYVDVIDVVGYIIYRCVYINTTRSEKSSLTLKHAHHGFVWPTECPLALWSLSSRE